MFSIIFIVIIFIELYSEVIKSLYDGTRYFYFLFKISFIINLLELALFEKKMLNKI